MLECSMGICAGVAIRTGSTQRFQTKNVIPTVLEIMLRNVEDSGEVQYSRLVSWSSLISKRHL